MRQGIPRQEIVCLGYRALVNLEFNSPAKRLLLHHQPRKAQELAAVLYGQCRGVKDQANLPGLEIVMLAYYLHRFGYIDGFTCPALGI